MRAVVQRVSRASVVVAGETVGAISGGLCVFVGVTHGDSPADADALAQRLATLRIFEDDDAKMNRSVLDVGGSVLVEGSEQLGPQRIRRGDLARGDRGRG